MGHSAGSNYHTILDAFLSFWLHFCRFAHLALAASNARSRRCSDVKVTKLRFPPIFPPFFPIADITREISVWLAFLGRLVCSVVGSAVDRSTIRKAARFTSVGRLLIRFGIDQVCHVRQPSQNSK